jgi:hypothetical protein
MKYILTPLTGLLITLFGLTAPIYMLLLVWFIRWDKEGSYVTHDESLQDDHSYVIRGDLPGFLRWAQTMDSRFPAGMYEAAMVASLGNESYLRRIWTSYQWCGLRNRAQGLSASFGKRSVGYISNPSDPNNRDQWWSKYEGFIWKYDRPEDGTWKRIVNLGPIAVTLGWQVYRLRDGNFWAVPVFTARKR